MKQLRPVLVLLLVMLLLLAGCDSSPGGGAGDFKDNESFSPVVPDLGFAQDTNGVSSMETPLLSVSPNSNVSGGSGNEAGRISTVENSATSGRKVIFSYDYRLQTTDMESTLSAIEKAVKTNDGYIENSTYTGRNDSDQFSKAELTIRIPIDSVGSFKSAVEASGHVTAKNEQGRDVSDEYFDTEARLKTLTTQEKRLLQLLERSESLSDTLTLERELTRVRTDIERLTGTLRKYDNLVDLATFSITVTYVKEIVENTEDEITFGEQLKIAFEDSMRIALEGAQSLLIVIVYLLPYLLIAGFFALIIILVFRRSAKKSKLAQAQLLASYAPPSSAPVNAGYAAPDKSLESQPVSAAAGSLEVPPKQD